MQGFTPLHVAAARGDAHIIRALLSAGALPTLPGSEGLLPIHVASSTGQLAAVRVLLEAAPQAALQKTQDGLTPLHVAAQEGHDALVSATGAQQRMLWGSEQHCYRGKYHHN